MTPPRPSGMVTLNEIPGFGEPTPAPRPPESTRTRHVLTAAIEALGVVTDDVAVQAIDVLANELVDVADRLALSELMLSQTLQLAYDQQCEIKKLRIRNHDLLDLARTARGTR